MRKFNPSNSAEYLDSPVYDRPSRQERDEIKDNAHTFTASTSKVTVTYVVRHGLTHDQIVERLDPNRTTLESGIELAHDRIVTVSTITRQQTRKTFRS